MPISRSTPCQFQIFSFPHISGRAALAATRKFLFETDIRVIIIWPKVMNPLNRNRRNFYVLIGSQEALAPTHESSICKVSTWAVRYLGLFLVCFPLSFVDTNPLSRLGPGPRHMFKFFAHHSPVPFLLISGTVIFRSHTHHVAGFFPNYFRHGIISAAPFFKHLGQRYDFLLFTSIIKRRFIICQVAPVSSVFHGNVASLTFPDNFVVWTQCAGGGI